jgi:acyl-CoA thioesterase YciA
MADVAWRAERPGVRACGALPRAWSAAGGVWKGRSTIVESLGEAALRVTMMPRDTNVHGTIFGGIILSYIDQAGAVQARRHGCMNVVTVAMDGVVFHEPVYVGDLVSFVAHTVATGRTSIRIRVTVEAMRYFDDARVTVTEAEVVYVNVDAQRRPTPIPTAPA